MLLSVITVNYNNIHGLTDTIASVLSQSYTDFEWIVVDGGSDDGSKQVLDEHKDRFAWYCSEPDKGIYNAMNKGVSHASGDYCVFLNSGDCFNGTSTLKEVVSMIDGYSDVYYGRGVLLYPDGSYYRSFEIPDHLSIDFFVNRNTLFHQASFIKTALLKERPYDESYRIAADADFFFYQFLHNRVFTYMDIDVAKDQFPGISNSDGTHNEVSRLIFRNIVERFLPHKLALLCLMYEKTRSVFRRFVPSPVVRKYSPKS